MRKIRIIEHITLDGVIQAPGGPGEDGDYPYGGWAAPHDDPAGGHRRGSRRDVRSAACPPEPTIFSVAFGLNRQRVRWPTV